MDSGIHTFYLATTLQNTARFYDSDFSRYALIGREYLSLAPYQREECADAVQSGVDVWIRTRVFSLSEAAKYNIPESSCKIRINRAGDEIQFLLDYCLDLDIDDDFARMNQIVLMELRRRQSNAPEARIDLLRQCERYLMERLRSE
jgi:hypothetical protein